MIHPHRITVTQRVKGKPEHDYAKVNADGYMNMEELKIALDKFGVEYPADANRTTLLELYETALKED